MDYIKSYKKESPFLNMIGMGGGVSSLLTLASGEITYIDDVFSIDLWDGDGASTRTITNGIDLSGEGGMVWGKTRSTSVAHVIADTENGVSKNLFTNTSDALEDRGTGNGSVDQFNSDGFAIGNSNNFINYSGHTACSWTFRKCPGFFDVVTFTSNNSSSGVSVSHSLGSTPGMIWVKSTSDSSTNWWVWHNSSPVDSGSPPDGVPAGSRKIGKLNDTASFTGSPNIINSVTSTSFNYGNNGAGYNDDTNTTFVAYVFAHNDGSFGEDSDEAVIKCDSYTGTQSEDTEINVGFEPQWILIKNTSSGSTDWVIVDNMRGLPVGSDSEVLKANAASTPASYRAAALTPTGFKLGQAVASVNGSGDTYIYIAIRRPHKPPEAGTDVFKPELLTSASQTFNPGFAPDMNWHMFDRSSSSGFAITGTRLTGNGSYLQTYSTGAEAGSSGSNWEYDAPTGKFTQGISSGSTGGGIEYFFKRAPGFMDIVAWSGNGSANRAISHNLNAVPELIFSKCRTNTENWMISTDDLITSAEGFFFTNASKRTGMSAFSSVSAPTSSAFYVGSDSSINGSGRTYLAFIFASLAGISKIGTYTGTGSDGINVDCGFTAGARLVIIKRIDGTGNWFCWDSARGIVSGNDPWLALNGGQEDATTDYIDPLNAGFIVNGSSSAQINTSGGTYQFLAIA